MPTPYTLNELNADKLVRVLAFIDWMHDNNIIDTAPPYSEVRLFTFGCGCCSDPVPVPEQFRDLLP